MTSHRYIVIDKLGPDKCWLLTIDQKFFKTNLLIQLYNKVYFYTIKKSATILRASS